MIDIFTNYTTGTREWTYARKRFTEHEFRFVFQGVLPNNIICNAVAAFRIVTHLDVLSFSVPMNRSVPPEMQRKVLFIENLNSEYRSMVSFLTDLPIRAIRAFDGDGHSGSMSEYDILDFIEPTNDTHQRVLIDTWFDVTNWFRILTSYNYEVHGEIDDIINGWSPEPLNAAADVFVPELTQFQLQSLETRRLNWQQPTGVVQWDVRDLL